MNRADVIGVLKRHEAELKKLGVEHLFLFGSTARDDAKDDSDVDLFFDHAKGQLGLYELMDVKERAQKILGRRTDIMTRASLHPVFAKKTKKLRYACSDGGSIARSAPSRHGRGHRAHSISSEPTELGWNAAC
jgi:uncharacterized protein